MEVASFELSEYESTKKPGMNPGFNGGNLIPVVS